MRTADLVVCVGVIVGLVALGSACEPVAESAVDAGGADLGAVQADAGPGDPAAPDAAPADAPGDAAPPAPRDVRTPPDAPAFVPGPPAPLFDPTRVCAVDLTLEAAEWEAFLLTPEDWHPAVFRFHGCGPLDTGPRDVLVRTHGAAGLDPWTAQLRLKVNFDPAGDGTRLAGLRRLTLHVTDGTLVREALAYRLFREAGLPASATGYARVTLQGADRGIYVLVETVDEHWADRLFATTAHVWEAEEPWTDLAPYDWHGLEAEVGDDDERDALEDLVEAVQEASDDRFLEELLPFVDWDQVLRYLAMERVLGVRDGYTGWQRHYFLHEDEDGRFRMAPWALDESLRAWDDHLWGTLTDGSLREVEPGVRMGAPGRPWLLSRCLRQPACAARYLDALGAALAFVDAAPLEDWTAGLLAALDGAVDPQIAPSVLELLREQLNRVRPVVACARTPEYDGDGDGAPCAVDCDDQEPLVHPGAAEGCDGMDLDCSGAPFDGGEPCDCREPWDWHGVDPTLYLVCETPRPWAEARALCQAHGSDLLIASNGAEIAHILNPSRWGLGPGERASWLGLTDREAEGRHVWVDGQPLPDPPGPPPLEWVVGSEPPREDRDCVAWAPRGGLVELDCARALPFFCELPCDVNSDADGDGYLRCEDDCNDRDGDIHPGALETSCGTDMNCDGQVTRCPD